MTFGVIALVSLALILVSLLQTGVDGVRSGPVPFLYLPVFVASTWGFCYGWELYDTGRATRLAIILAFSGLAVVIVIALVLLAAAASDSDLDLDLGGITGTIGDLVGDSVPQIADAVGEVGLGVLEETYDARSEPWTLPDAVVAETGASTPAAGAPPPLSADDPRGVDCAACSYRYLLGARLSCPSCGAPA